MDAINGARDGLATDWTDAGSQTRSAPWDTRGFADASPIQVEFGRLRPYVDVVGISVYPCAFFGHADPGDPANLPDDWPSQIELLAGTKPVAITETGWIAEDLDISGSGLSVNSSPAAQAACVETLLAEADALEARFIIWFNIVDYDDLWENALAMGDVARIWEDTGLHDESLAARPALNAWDAALGLNRVEP